MKLTRRQLKEIITSTLLQEFKAPPPKKVPPKVIPKKAQKSLVKSLIPIIKKLGPRAVPIVQMLMVPMTAYEFGRFLRKTYDSIQDELDERSSREFLKKVKEMEARLERIEAAKRRNKEPKEIPEIPVWVSPEGDPNPDANPNDQIWPWKDWYPGRRGRSTNAEYERNKARSKFNKAVKRQMSPKERWGIDPEQDTEDPGEVCMQYAWRNGYDQDWPGEGLKMLGSSNWESKYGYVLTDTITTPAEFNNKQTGYGLSFGQTHGEVSHAIKHSPELVGGDILIKNAAQNILNATKTAVSKGVKVYAWNIDGKPTEIETAEDAEVYLGEMLKENFRVTRDTVTATLDYVNDKAIRNLQLSPLESQYMTIWESIKMRYRSEIEATLGGEYYWAKGISAKTRSDGSVDARFVLYCCDHPDEPGGRFVMGTKYSAGQSYKIATSYKDLKKTKTPRQLVAGTKPKFLTQWAKGGKKKK
jgi:hypothetical protein